MAIINYTKKNLIPGEKIIYAGELHRFCYFFPILLLLLGCFFLALPFLIEHVKKNDEMHETSPPGQIQEMSDRVGYEVDKITRHLPPEMLEWLKTANEVRQFILGSLFIFFGLIYILNTYIRKHTTEQVITNKKIIFKKGFIKVDETEIALYNVEGVKVFQGVLDRLINRGRVLVSGVGMEQIELQNLAKPNEFRNAAYTAVDHYAHHNHGYSQPSAAHAEEAPPQPLLNS